MTIQTTEFDGHPAVSIQTAALELVIVTDCGPRVAFLGKAGGENLLLWKTGTYGRDDWDLRGGHRVWATRPDADENEDTYAPDDLPCDVEIGENSVSVTGAESAENRTRRGMTVTVLDDQRLRVDNFVVNTGDLLYSCGVWGLTCTLPGNDARYVVPLGDGTEWDTYTMVAFRKWACHGQGGFNDPQITVSDDLMSLRPVGIENKRALLSHRGTIAMTSAERGVTFVKKVDYNPLGTYPLGTNIAFYVGPDNFMVEMETMGPERTLKPGESHHHVETWTLKPAASEFQCAADLDAFA